MQTGIHAARTIGRRLDGKEPQPFRYRDLGSMAVISRRRAVVSFRGLRLSGFAGWLAWLFVHLTFLTGFKNRFLTLFYWSFSFIGRSRTERALLPSWNPAQPTAPGGHTSTTENATPRRAT
jgi:NADH dehydrogenase